MAGDRWRQGVARGGRQGAGSWRGRARRGLAAALSAVLVGVVVVAMARANGFSAARLTLASGQAWVASSRVGQIALIDGSTEQKVASVTVAKPGDDISITQGGPDALVVNRTNGSILRVRGSTYADAPGAVHPLPDALTGLSVFAGTGSEAFAVDAGRGLAVALDRATMAVRGRPVSLAARLTGAATVIDTAGRLWAIDTASGDLVWFDHAGKHIRRGTTAPGPDVRLTLVRGEPAVIDPGRRQVSLLNPTNGKVSAHSCVDVAPGAPIEAGGSSSAALVFSVVPDRGVLLVSDLDSGQCSRAVSLTAPGARLGDPVETGGRVFVPDYGSGQVLVVDLSTNRVVAAPDVLPAGLQSFDLTPRDGFVFYNDPASQRSGVIRLDGSVHQISKYDPNNPSQQTRRPTRDTSTGQTVDGGSGSGNGNGSGGTGTGDSGNGDGAASAGNTSIQHPGDRPAQNPRPRHSPPTAAPPGSHNSLPAGNPPPPTDSTGTRGGTPPAAPPRHGGPNPLPPGQTTLRISAPPPYLAGTAIPLGVRADGQKVRVAAATWNFGDGSAAGNGVQTRHTWSTAGTYTVTVTGILANGSTASTSAKIPITSPAAPPNRPPTASLRISESSGRAPSTVTVDASGSHDPDGTIVSYAVDWNDGSAQSIGSSPALSHAYTRACQGCLITLTVTDDKGLTGSASQNVDINPPLDAPPKAVLKLTPKNALVGDDVTADASGSTDDNPGLEYSLDWGDPSSTPFGADPTKQHAYSHPATYTVTLTVRDSAGHTDSASAEVTVSKPNPPYPPPSADFTASPKTAPAGTTVTADGSSSGTQGPKSDLTYQYNWGDGSETQVIHTPVATHSYDKAGDYEIFLTVWDAYDQRDVNVFTVHVTAPPTPVKAVLKAPGATRVGLPYVVDASDSTGDGLTYHFDWGDGDTTGWISSPTATHDYSAECTCDVTLNVKDSNGTVKVDTAAVTVHSAQ